VGNLTEFVIQRRTADGWRRFIVEGQNGQAVGTSGRLARAMRFTNFVEADFYKLRFGLWDFEIVQAVDDDYEAERQAFKERRHSL
jgi:hypothetical protein